MEHAIRKAETLIEALGYIRKFRDRITVIKLGGSAMEDAEALTATLQDVIFMETVGLRPVLVHGGGKPIDRAMAQAGLVPRKVRGQRYTDERTLDIVVRVLLQEINAGIVRQVKHLGGRAVGVHTDSLQALYGRKATLRDETGQPLDLGLVGEVTRVDCDLIEDICRASIVPVLPSLVQDEAGRWLNVNADHAAAAVAAQMQADKLVFLTDTPGILQDRNDDTSVISSLDAEECDRLIRAGIIASGMIPKVQACLDSLRAGVKKTHIIDGRLRHSLLLEIFTDKGVGTEITLRDPTSSPSPPR
jgi:acetylglutamate kinase